MTTSRQTITYDGCALEAVELHNVKVRDCAACGERLTSIPSIEGLYSLLAGLIIQKPERLTGAEVRFLRKRLGWSSSDFAATFGVTPETVSRWESEARRMSTTADRLLRVCVAKMEPATEYPLEHLRDVANESPHTTRYQLTREGAVWHTAV